MSFLSFQLYQAEFRGSLASILLVKSDHAAESFGVSQGEAPEHKLDKHHLRPA